VADDLGNTISDPVMCAAMAALVFRTYPGSTVVVTADQPLLYERLAELNGGHVRRCPADPQALMQAAADDGIAMAGDGNGYFVFPALHPAIDGLFALGKLLELLARQQMRLSDVIAGLPSFHIATGTVDGMWETKGRIMRCLIQQFTKLRVETLDGIKIYLNDTEWVLIKPDNDTATFHLTAEARSLQAAQEIIADYGGIVHSYVQTPCPDEPAPEPLTPR
jgi:phosphomannomutase